MGVPTAGGVISTGGTGIMDLGFIRKPFRAWYLKGTGEDMEFEWLAFPHHVVWPEPGDMPKGVDRQLDKAIDVLKEDVAKFNAGPKAGIETGQPTAKELMCQKRRKIAGKIARYFSSSPTTIERRYPPKLGRKREGDEVLLACFRPFNSEKTAPRPLDEWA